MRQRSLLNYKGQLMNVGMNLRLVFVLLVCARSSMSAVLYGNIIDEFVLDNQQDVEPPPHEKTALMARYIVHTSDWASIGTISSTESIKGYPFVGMKSVVDGPVSKSTGIPYMMMTHLDISMNDLNHENKCTLFMTLAEGHYCYDQKYDPQDPRCARVMLTGSVEKLKEGSEEEEFARDALYSRHPVMKNWPKDHEFFIVKLNIKQIALLDFFGGVHYINLDDYLNAKDEQTFGLTNIIEVVQIRNRGSF